VKLASFGEHKKGGQEKGDKGAPQLSRPSKRRSRKVRKSFKSRSKSENAQKRQSEVAMKSEIFL
jgi:hypothetical protein